MIAGTLHTDRQACFQFKASFSPCTILQLTRYDLAALESQLAETIQKAPNFFIGSPVVVDLEKVNSLGSLNFSQLKQILINNNLVPVGVRGGSQEQLSDAASNGLPIVSVGKTSFANESAKKKEDTAHSVTKFVSTPIRSGMQVYARGGDLIVTTQVSPGAELLADGYIHVYGALRGRALAGVQGNTKARIFCQTLEAELVSIAGYYLTKEDMQALPKHEGMIQIYLEEEHVKIKAI